MRYVLDLMRNRILEGALDACGCSVKNGRGVIRIIGGSMVIMKGYLRNGLYVLDGLNVV